MKKKEFPWPLDNEVQALQFSGILAEEGVTHRLVRHGGALWGYAENLSEGWGHLEAPEEDKDRVDALYHDFLESEAGTPEAE